MKCKGKQSLDWELGGLHFSVDCATKPKPVGDLVQVTSPQGASVSSPVHWRDWSPWDLSQLWEWLILCLDSLYFQTPISHSQLPWGWAQVSISGYHLSYTFPLSDNIQFQLNTMHNLVNGGCNTPLCMVLEICLFYNQQICDLWLRIQASKIALIFLLGSSCQIQMSVFMFFHLMNFVPSIDPLWKPPTHGFSSHLCVLLPSLVNG